VVPPKGWLLTILSVDPMTLLACEPQAFIIGNKPSYLFAVDTWSIRRKVDCGETISPHAANTTTWRLIFLVPNKNYVFSSIKINQEMFPFQF
jgi:hypothetical protein